MQPPPFPENKTNQKTASNPGHILGMKSNTASRGCRAWRDPLERGANCTKKSAPQRELKTSGKRWGRNEATLLLDVTELSSPYHTGLLLSFLVRLSPFPSFFLGGGGLQSFALSGAAALQSQLPLLLPRAEQPYHPAADQ